LVWGRRVFLAGQAVSLLGDGLAFLAIPLLVLEFSRSPLVSAISAASLTIGYAEPVAHLAPRAAQEGPGFPARPGRTAP
jgi:hypothetical protein